MRSRYDWDQMNAFLDRLEVRIRYGKIELSKEPQLYANRFSYALEDGVVSESYDGHFYCPRQIIRTNDDNIALLAIYVFSQREEVFWDFPGVSSAAGREQRVRASRRVSIGEARPDSFFAQRRGDGEDDWFVGYQDGKEAVTFFSGLSWETALFYLEGFVQAEPGFDALFDRLRRETGIAPTERSVLLAIYLCGCGGTQLYGEQDVRREYPPEGAGRFDFARVDSFLYHKHGLFLDEGSFGEYNAFVEKQPSGVYLLCHQFDEKRNAEPVVEDEDPARVLLAARFFIRFDNNGSGSFIRADEQQRLALRQDPRVSYSGREPGKFYLLQEGDQILLGVCHGEEDLPLDSFSAQYGFTMPENELFRYLRLFKDFEPLFRSLCRPGLLLPRDWSFVFRAAMEGFFG